MISIGDRRTRKKVVLEQMYRQTLTEEAMKKLHKKGQVPEIRGKKVDPEEAAKENQQSEPGFTELKQKKNEAVSTGGPSAEKDKQATQTRSRI